MVKVEFELEDYEAKELAHLLRYVCCEQPMTGALGSKLYAVADELDPKEMSGIVYVLYSQLYDLNNPMTPKQRARRIERFKNAMKKI